MILHMAWVQGDNIWSQICRYPNRISREEDTLNYFIFTSFTSVKNLNCLDLYSSFHLQKQD